MRTIHKLIFSLFLATTTCFHLLYSMDLIFKIPEMRDHIFNLMFYSYKTDTPTQIHNNLGSLISVDKKFHEYFTNPKTTRTIINIISDKKNQHNLAQKIVTSSMINYLKKNNALYKHINSMNINKINHLLEQGADPNFYPEKESKGLFKIPLLLRPSKDCKKTKMLLDAGADVDVIYEGKTALQLSIEQNKVKRAKLLLTYNPKNLCLQTAIYHKKHKIIDAILSKKNIPSQQLSYALGAAIQQSDVLSMNKLISAGASIEQYLGDIRNKFIELANNTLNITIK